MRREPTCYFKANWYPCQKEPYIHVTTDVRMDVAVPIKLTIGSDYDSRELLYAIKEDDCWPYVYLSPAEARKLGEKLIEWANRTENL